MRLSPSFTFEELTFTSHKQFLKQNRLDAKIHLLELQLLSCYILEPLRHIIGVPLLITSGFRNKELNSFLGSSAKSQHLLGQACDFIPRHTDLEEAFLKIQKSGLHYGQLILEKGWLHISLGFPFRTLEKCSQNLRFK